MARVLAVRDIQGVPHVDHEHDDEELAYQWLVFFHHNDHYHPEFPIDERESRVRINPAGCGEETYYYRVRLEVTDAAGLVGYDKVYLYPYCGPDILQFIDLTGTVDEESITLTWQVSDADQVVKYVVEREDAHLQFVPVGETMSGVRTFTDTEPGRGLNTYRVVAMTERDTTHFPGTCNCVFRLIRTSWYHLIPPRTSSTS